MDKFEQHIKSAQHIHQPTNNFVDKTMGKLDDSRPKKRFSLKTWGPIFVGSVAVLAIIFFILPFGAKKTTSVTLTQSSKPSKVVADTGTPSAGTDDASLASDISSINSSIGQENTDQVSANSALNDQAQEIVVPTSN
jgi:hypothetical protein